MLIIGAVAAGMRFWELGDIPPGLYRDEALNGLDALGVLDGRLALYFPANNGREPAYIYLTALSIALLGPTALAVRVAAAVAGTLTTWLVYRLAWAWFGRPVGLVAAALWAFTVWPVHLSRIGLRIVLLVAPLTAAAWLATEAYRASTPGRPLTARARALWLAAGLAYGAVFYTYLASRFTPLLVVLGLLFLIGQGRGRRLWPGLLWAAAGTGLLLLPWAWLWWQDPALILGRTGQVSIFNADINKSDFWGTLWQHSGRSLGLFLWAGDDIIRHNPPGRPLFDWIMAGPFVVGLVWLARSWRRPAAWATLLWIGVMLGPTLLAEDAPHFLRAVGVLPAALFVPAVGLSQFATWPKLATRPFLGWALVGVLLAGSWGLTIRDYFTKYGPAAETAYLFEAAARDLADEINRAPPKTFVVADGRFREGWPSVAFLTDPTRPITWLSAGETPPISPPALLFLWPHGPGDLSAVAETIRPPAVITAVSGSLARGDLEPAAYPLYARYEVGRPTEQGLEALFAAEANGPQVRLERAQVRLVSAQTILVELLWSTEFAAISDEPLTVFVHIQNRENMALVGQADSPPAQGLWPTTWWRPGVTVADIHRVELAEPYDAGRHEVVIGLYPAGRPEARWLAAGPDGTFGGNTWTLSAFPDR